MKLKMLLLMLCSAALLAACDTYEEDHHGHRHTAVYREGYYGGADYDGYAGGTYYRTYPSYSRTYYRLYPAYSERGYYRSYPERAYVRPYYRGYRGWY